MNQILAIILLLGVSSSSALYFSVITNSLQPALKKELDYANAINAVLCSNGTHSDAVAQQFYACYDESLFKGANKFITCQENVFGVKLNTEKNIDAVCSTGSIKKYGLCLFSKLPLPPNATLPSKALHALNECQGKVMGVARPQ